MKIKSNVNYGHWFVVLGKRINIPAGMVVDFTKAQIDALSQNQVYNNAIKSGALEIKGAKKPKKEKSDELEG